MALDRGSGASLWSPLAITVIGGMISGTFLTLVIVPSIYVIFEDISKGIVWASATTRKMFTRNRKYYIETERL